MMQQQHTGAPVIDDDDGGAGAGDYRTRCGGCGRGFYSWATGRRHLDYGRGLCQGAGLYQYRNWDAEPAPAIEVLTLLGWPDGRPKGGGWGMATPGAGRSNTGARRPPTRAQRAQRARCAGKGFMGAGCQSSPLRGGRYCTLHHPKGAAIPAGYQRCPVCLRVVKLASLTGAGVCLKQCRWMTSPERRRALGY